MALKLLAPVLLIFTLLINNPLIAGENEVPGLKLPAKTTVKFDEGFVTIKAECTGPVKWMILSTLGKVKFKVNDAAPNEADVAIPPYKGEIMILAVGLVDTKLTNFATTYITVDGPDKPDPNPKPNPPDPVNVPLPLHLSIVEDPQARTAATRALLGNDAMWQQLKTFGVLVRVYPKDSAAVTDKKFDAVVAKYGLPVLILQDNNGKGLWLGRLPATADALLNVVKPYTGK